MPSCPFDSIVFGLPACPSCSLSAFTAILFIVALVAVFPQSVKLQETADGVASRVVSPSRSPGHPKVAARAEQGI